MPGDRHCGVGNHWTAPENFRLDRPGVLSRNCRSCEAQRKPPTPVPDLPSSRRAINVGTRAPYTSNTNERRIFASREFPGVDIDSIYSTRPDLVKK